MRFAGGPMRQGMELRLRQQLALTPQLQQALRLLQLSALEFSQEIEQALASNPFLEDEGDPAASLPSRAAPVAPSAAGVAAPADDGAEPRRGEDSGQRGQSFDDTDWTERSEAPITLRDHLRGQLLLSQMGERDRALAHLVIDALN